MGTLLDQVYGCLVGGAIGDALGAAVENWHYADIRGEHGKVTDFLPQSARSRDGQPGQITDDSTLRQYLCQAIIEAGGRIGPDQYARVWLDRLNPDRLFVTERLVLEKLRLGMSPWETGRGQLAADAAIMAIAPVGVINAAEPAQAYQDGYLLAGINQDGLERDAAATFAAGIAACFIEAASAMTVIDVMRCYTTDQVRRLLDAGAALAETSTDVAAFVSKFYDRMLDRTFPCPPGETWDPERSVAATSREVVPAVTGLLWLCGHDPNHALVEAASFGRDADTIASVLGGIVGALHGASALRPDWIQECEQANAAFFAEAGHSTSSFNVTAAGLVDALQSELDKTNQRAETQARPIEPWTFVKGKMPLVKEAPHVATLSGRSSAWPRVSRGDSSEHFALWAGTSQHAPRTIFSWVERVSLDEFIDGSSDRQCRPSAGISECLHRLSSGLPASRTVNYYAPTIAVRMP